MLQRSLRFVLAAAVSFVVSAQGMASVMAGQCMALGHHQQDEEHAHDAHAGGHAAGDHHAADPQSGAAHDEESVANSGDGKGGHCGPCTACCASASIAGAARISFPPAHPGAAYAFSPLAPLGVQPGELDRPPLAL